MKISDHVKGMCKFSFFRAGNLWYITDTGFEFPVPVEDTDTATFNDTMKSLTLMRWIRKHIALWEDGISPMKGPVDNIAELRKKYAENQKKNSDQADFKSYS